MSEPHIIRLRGPWQLRPLVRFVTGGEGEHREEPLDAPPCRVSVPGDWTDALGCDFLGRARYTRPFNRPTNLEPHERVWLVLEGVDLQGSVLLNGLLLGSAAGCQTAVRFDITMALTLHNLLEVDVTMTAAALPDPSVRPARAGLAGGLTGEVRLEIVRT
jgi:beta-galactosidase/beta-glucuronidase